MLLKKSLSPLSKNLKDTWDIFKSQIKPFFLLGLLETVSGTLLALILGGITAGGFIAKIVSLGMNETLTAKDIIPVVVSNLPSLSIGALLVLTAFAIFSSIFLVARIVSMTGTTKFSDLLSKGKDKMFLAFGLNLLVGLIFFGNFWLFIVPGLLVLFLMSFAIYELVIEQKTILNSMLRSMAIVTKNFWPILGRVVVIGVATLFLRAIFSGNKDEESFSLLSLVINTLSGWYCLVYSYVLYKEASAITPKNYKHSLGWVVIPSLIGWTILAISIMFGVQIFKHTGAFDNLLETIEQSIEENQEIKLPDNLTNLEETS